MKGFAKIPLFLLVCWPLAGSQGNRAQLYLLSAN